MNPSKRIHCPECHSRNLTPIVETDITGGTSLNHSISRKNSVGTTHFTNTHRNYWMCGDCGHKFRNLQNLTEEIKTLHKNATGAVVILGLMLLILIVGIPVMGFEVSAIVAFPCILLAVVLLLITKHKIRTLEAERVYLKKHCFA